MGTPLSGFDSFGQALPTHGEDNTFTPQGNDLGPLGFYGAQIKKIVTLVGVVADINAITPTGSTLPLAYAINGRKGQGLANGEATGKGTGVHAYWDDTNNLWKTVDTKATLAA